MKNEMYYDMEKDCESHRSFGNAVNQSIEYCNTEITQKKKKQNGCPPVKHRGTSIF